MTAESARLMPDKTCPKCKAMMRFARLAAHALLQKTDVLTYKCDCGESAVHYVTQVQHSLRL